MLSRHLATALLCALAVACSGAPPLSPPVSVSTPTPGVVDRTVRAALMIETTGALSLSVEGEALLKIYEIGGPRIPTQARFLSISAAEPVEAPDGRLVLFTADLAPGLYEGPATYTMVAEGAVSVSGRRVGVGSAAYIQVFREGGGGGVDSLRRFDQIVEPCTLSVGKEQRSGRLECPALADASGEQVALRWEWQLL